MTVHPIRTNGTLIAAPQTYHYFDRLQERIVRFVTKNSGISEKKLLALMLAAEDMAADVGSILYGEEAVADGLIDRINAEVNPPCTVVATGGLSSVIAPLCRNKIILDDDLLLKGLSILFEKNKPKN